MGLVLFVDEYPVLDLGHDVERVEAVDGLVEVGAHGVQLAAENEHVCQEVIEGLVAVADVYRLLQQDAPAVVAEGWAKGFSSQFFYLRIFFFR